MPLVSRRLALPAAFPEADSNIRVQYPIQHGTWIAHPNSRPDDTSFCHYELGFELRETATFTVHVSADQRFELLCDGEFVGMGPDRSDTGHWSFHSYEITLNAGAHELVGEVTFLHELFPHAQTFIRPAFLLYAEDAPVEMNTGAAPWRVKRHAGISVCPPPINSYHVVGPNYTFDGAALFDPGVPLVAAVNVGSAGHDSSTGCVLGGWKLHPSRLPEQLRQPVGGGRIRAVGEGAPENPFAVTGDAVNAGWQALIEGGESLSVPAGQRVVVLWDLEQYHTAFLEVVLSGGAGARLEVLWAESCFEDKGYRLKGHRDAIEGKYFLGYGDTFIADGGAQRTFHPPWWRAGRYIRIVVETAEAELDIDTIRLLESRLPIENGGCFESDDARLQSIIPIAVRGIQMCSHETYMDCPYYEQLMYVGDTRLQVLTSFVMTAEDRLNRRALELFDWSRRENGFVLERHPSTPRQLSTTFSMIWILMLRDFAWWRDDTAFVKARMKGLRCLLEEFRAHQGDEPLLRKLPGWSFVDWVPSWQCGCAPDAELGTSGVVNLLFLNALCAAAELENDFGEAHLARRNREWAEALATSVRERFWDADRWLFADDLDHTHWSEHAQCLALLSGCYGDIDEQVLSRLAAAPDLRQTTVYFSFYLLETFARFGRGDLLYRRLDSWKDMVELGFRTPVEMPEPSRSDCHAWGSHPLFHMHASLAGIRPDAPGFARVRIKPQPAELKRIRSRIPHPAGTVSLSMQKEGREWVAAVSLPPGVPGTLAWGEDEYELEGESEHRLKEAGGAT